MPTILNEVAAEYEFIGYTGDRSIKTNFLTLLLNMHDYNHQNGTHRQLFEIEEVQLKQFIDNGLHSCVFILMFMKAHTPIAHLIKRNLLHLVEVVVEQDADILGKLYANTPQHIKLNNEVGMDWVRRNFESFPTVVGPNLSLAAHFKYQ